VKTLGRSGLTSHASSAKPTSVSPRPRRGHPHRVTEAIPVGYPECDRFRRDDPGQMDGPQERRDHEAVHQHVIADEAQDRDAHGASQAQPEQAVQEEAGEDQQLEETQQKKRKEHRSTNE
jgi:hypothetical protein